jgi:uroporphyrinogen decarboxylase
VEPEARLRAAVAREPVDRPPFGWWGHTYEEEWSPRALADVTLDRRAAFGWDFVKLQPRACCFAEAFGSEYRRADAWDEGPVLVRPAVIETEDWAGLPAVDASVAPLADQVEALRLVVEDLGSSVPVIQTVFSPLMVAEFLAGEDRDRTARELIERRGVLAPALERIADALADFVVRSVEAGAAGIFFAIAGFASGDVVPAREYAEVALPHDRTVIEAIPDAAWFDVLHLCGPRQRFELAAELDLPAVSWSIHEAGNPSLADGATITDRAVMGGVDRATLEDGASRDVEAQVDAAIEATSGVGVIVAPGCSVSPTAPEANLLAMSSDVLSRPGAPR